MSKKTDYIDTRLAKSKTMIESAIGDKSCDEKGVSEVVKKT